MYRPFIGCHKAHHGVIFTQLLAKNKYSMHGYLVTAACYK